MPIIWIQGQNVVGDGGSAIREWYNNPHGNRMATGENVYLEQSNIPVPEFSGAAVVAL